MLHLLALVLSLHSPSPNLSGCVRYWQRALSLEEWRVTVKVVGRSALDDGTLGDIEPHPSRRTAVIRILGEGDYDLPARQARADQRLTIAHEMVHLDRLVHCDQRTWRDEDLTNQETLALLRAHRRWRELSVFE
jgi:hypothetical protein